MDLDFFANQLVDHYFAHSARQAVDAHSGQKIDKNSNSIAKWTKIGPFWQCIQIDALRQVTSYVNI